jgi:NADPH:quinone reductase-like Zn-dependent oxidoreductase
MKVWRYNDSPQSPGLFEAKIEPPKPRPGEIVIQVHAVGITPTELLWYPTTHDQSGNERRHAIPGHEFSGVITACDEDADAAVDQEVFGLNDWFADGACAEYCCTRPAMVVPKPANLTHEQAASAPIGALTAWQGLFDRANLEPGERVLIHGGSGGVGVFAIQLARRKGAHVITTASERNREVLLKLGAERVIDYHSERFEDVAGHVDVVFDTVGGATLERSWTLVGERGRLVTIAASSEGAGDEQTKQAFFIVEPDQQQLREIAGQLESGDLAPAVKRVFPFNQADQAFRTDNVRQSGCRKTVVSVIP